MNPQIRSVIVFVCSLLIFHSCSYEKYELQYNLVPGKVYTLEMNAEQTLNQQLAGEEQVMHTKMITSMSYYVKGLDDQNNYLIEIVFTSLFYELESPYINLSMDSRTLKDSVDVYSIILKELINKPFDIKMNLEGEISEVKGLNEYFQRVINQYEFGPEQKIQLQETLKKAYGEDAFKGNMEIMTSMFPGKLVRIGSKWKNTLQLRKGVNATLENTYRLKSRKDGNYIIENEAIAKSNQSEHSEGQQMNYDIGGKQKGTYKISEKSGWIMEAQISQDFEGKVVVSPGPGVPKKMEWPLQFSSSMKIIGKEL